MRRLALALVIVAAAIVACSGPNDLQKLGRPAEKAAPAAS